MARRNSRCLRERQSDGINADEEDDLKMDNTAEINSPEDNEVGIQLTFGSAKMPAFKSIGCFHLIHKCLLAVLLKFIP